MSLWHRCDVAPRNGGRYRKHPGRYALFTLFPRREGFTGQPYPHTTADSVAPLLNERRYLKPYLLCWIAPTLPEVKRLGIEVP